MVWKIVLGVTLGVLAAAFVIYLVISFAGRNDLKDCLIENNERGMAGQPQQEC